MGAIEASYTSPTWRAKIRTTLTSMPACLPDPSPIQAAIRSSQPCTRRTRSICISCCGPMARARIIFPRAFPSISSPPRNIAVPASGNKSKKAHLREILAERKLTRITEAEWRNLLGALAPVSESYLRHLLADSGVPVEQPFGGVRQKTFEELEQ